MDQTATPAGIATTSNAKHAISTSSFFTTFLPTIDTIPRTERSDRVRRPEGHLRGIAYDSNEL